MRNPAQAEIISANTKVLKQAVFILASISLYREEYHYAARQVDICDDHARYATHHHVDVLSLFFV